MLSAAGTWFAGLVATDGRGSPRDDLYQDYTDDEMRLVRFKEQRKAAIIGEFAAQIMLDIPSKMIKDASRSEPVDDILAILRATRQWVGREHRLSHRQIGCCCHILLKHGQRRILAGSRT